MVRVHAASVNARDWHVRRGEPRVGRLMDRTPTSPALVTPTTPSWTLSGTVACTTCVAPCAPAGSLVLSGGGTPGNGRLVGPLRLIIGSMAVARLQPFEVTVPQAVPDATHEHALTGSATAWIRRWIAGLLATRPGPARWRVQVPLLTLMDRAPDCSDAVRGSMHVRPAAPAPGWAPGRDRSGWPRRPGPWRR